MNPAESATAIRNTIFAFDEAHHIQAADEAANQLGEVVSFILRSGDPTVRILLATAFFFRGDRLSILPEEHFSRFCRLSIPFDRYWNSLKHLETYQYDFVAYKGSIWPELERLLAHSQEPTIIYCPPEGHRLLLGTPKRSFTNRALSLIEKCYDAELWRPGVTPSKPVVLNLVDTNHRAEKVQFAMKHGDKIAVILSVGMFREGADWIQAQRVIDLIPSGSDQDRNQRFGRLIRDFPGKKTVSYYSFFPRIADAGDEDQRRNLTKLFAHFHASLVLENAIVPIRVLRQRDLDRSESNGCRKRMDFLGTFDERTQEGILADCSDALLKLNAEAEEAGTSVSHTEAFREITGVLNAWQIREHLEPLAKQIVLILRRRADLNLPVDDLVEAGFDKVWASDALEGLRLYSAGFGGPDTFRAIRQAVYTVFDARWQEMYDKVRLLPAPPPSFTRAQWWMNNNRSLHNEGKLSRERVKLLERIPWWSWRTSIESRFARQVDALKSLSAPPEIGSSLYKFAAAMRGSYKAGKLSTKQVEMLESITWWKWETRPTFADCCKEAASLSEEPAAGTRLYRWMWRNRKRHKRGELAEDAIRQLEAIHWWSWESKRKSAWDTVYETTVKLAKPPSGKKHPTEYRFVQAQKASYMSGKLSKQQVELLEAIPWWSWESHAESTWRLNFESIASLPEPPRFSERLKEYRFVKYQQAKYKAGKLSKKEVELLETVPWWEW
jgi:hypothetical protein